jgi:hypothetical protein
MGSGGANEYFFSTETARMEWNWNRVGLFTFLQVYQLIEALYKSMQRHWKASAANMW